MAGSRCVAVPVAIGISSGGIIVLLMIANQDLRVAAAIVHPGHCMEIPGSGDGRAADHRSFREGDRILAGASPTIQVPEAKRSNALHHVNPCQAEFQISSGKIRELQRRTAVHVGGCGAGDWRRALQSASFIDAAVAVVVPSVADFRPPRLGRKHAVVAVLRKGKAVTITIRRRKSRMDGEERENYRRAQETIRAIGKMLLAHAHPP